MTRNQLSVVVMADVMLMMVGVTPMADVLLKIAIKVVSL
jgi:hypothetical protein